MSPSTCIRNRPGSLRDLGLLGLAALWLLSGLARAGESPQPPTAQKPASAAQPLPTADDEYLRLFKLLAETFDQVDRNYVKDVDRRRLMEAAIRGMLSELDPYSSYVTPEQVSNFKTGVENEFGGVGVQLAIERGQLMVLSPIVGTPAYRAGLLAGDRILEIDNKSTEGITMDEAVRRMQGKVGEQVSLRYMRRTAKDPATVTLQRELIRLETILGDTRQPDDSWKWMYDDERKIGYVRLTAFGRRTGEELKKVLDELVKQQLRGLILDLRSNPGGLLSAAIEVSDLFISSGRIVSTEGRNSKPKVWEAHKTGTFEGFAMAVLVNRYSASASEIVAACLQDHNRAVVVGERTWGKGSVQTVVELENGTSMLKLTTADYHRPSGKNIHRFPDASEKDEWGVIPNADFTVPLSATETIQWMNYRRDRDIVRKPPEPAPSEPSATPPFVDRPLQKAVEYLQQQLRDAPQNATVTAKP